MTLYPYSLPEFLALCQYVGADPYYVVPPTWNTTETLGLIEYLAGPSTSQFGQTRASLGQTDPWISVFDTIYLEFVEVQRILLREHQWEEPMKE